MILTPPLKQTSRGTPRDLGSLIAMASQLFGENIEYYKKHGLGDKGHRGVDWGCPIGTEIYACAPGTVSSSYVDGFGGLIIVVDHGFGYRTSYVHFSAFKVSQGDTVERGQLIGLSGNSGLSTAPHCHLGLTLNGVFIDPIPYLRWWGYTGGMEVWKRIVAKLYKSWVLKDPDGVEYWGNIVDSPERLENLLDQRIRDIGEVVKE